MSSIDLAMHGVVHPPLGGAVVETPLDHAIRDVVGVAATEPMASKPKAGKSRCARLLLSMFGWGLIKATIVQRIAAAVVEDFREVGVDPPPSLLDLASLGSDGHHVNNIRRDLWRWLAPRLSCIPSPICIRAPYVRARSITRHVVEYMNLPIMMPNLLIECLYQDFPDCFKQMLGSGLETFWSQVSEGTCTSLGSVAPRLRGDGK